MAFQSSHLTRLFFICCCCTVTGGDSRLEQPIRRYAGGSSLNTATHLHSLIGHFFKENDEKDDNRSSSLARRPTVTLRTVFNPEDTFGKILLKHREAQGFEMINCYHQPEEDSASLSTAHCVAIVSGGERSFMTHQGCVGTFSADHLDLSRIVNTNHNIHVHIAGYFNVEGFHNGNLRNALQEIRSKRMETAAGAATVVSLVTQHDASKQWDGGLAEVTSYLDFLIMNELEASSIFERACNNTIGGGGTHNESSSTSSLRSQDELVQSWVDFFPSGTQPLVSL